MTTTISADAKDKCVTLINVFTVDPANAQKLLDMLVRSTNEHVSKMDGFVSANFHLSHDRTRLVNYAQWRSREAWEKIFDEESEVIERALELATLDSNHYDVVSVHAPAG